MTDGQNGRQTGRQADRQAYFPVSMLERDGQHMGVVTKALEKEVPPSSMTRRVLFIASMEPVHNMSITCSSHPDVTELTVLVDARPRRL